MTNMCSLGETQPKVGSRYCYRRCPSVCPPSRWRSTLNSYGIITARKMGTQLCKTMLNSNGTVVAKKTVSSMFNSGRTEDFQYTIDPDPTVFMQWHTQQEVFNAFCHYDCSSSVNFLQQRFPLSQRVLCFLL